MNVICCQLQDAYWVENDKGFTIQWCHELNWYCKNL